MPPWSFTYLKYASMPRATLPAIAASPLSGTLEPRWISVADTPGVATGRAPAEVTPTAATIAHTKMTLEPTPTWGASLAPACERPEEPPQEPADPARQQEHDDDQHGTEDHARYAGLLRVEV